MTISASSANRPQEPFSDAEVSELRALYGGKKVSVAGGTGMIGRELVSLLAQSGASVSVSGIETPEQAMRILPNQIRYQQIDWSVGPRPQALRDCDVVFNLLGRKGSVGIGEKRVASFLMPMLRYQANLIEAAHAANVKTFLFVSSLNVYPQSKLHFEDNAWNGLPLQNDRIPGIGKRVGEIMGLAYELEHDWKAFKVVRPANVFGPNDVLDPVGAHVVPSLIRKMLTDTTGTVEVWGDGSAVRDFVYSQDCAFWLAKAAHYLPANHPVNLGSGVGVSILELAQLIKHLVGYQGRLSFSPDGPTGDPVRILDMTRATEILGWKIRTPLEDGLMKTIEWARMALAVE